MNRCALCGRVLRVTETGAGYVRYCPGCGVEWPVEIDGYNEQADYTTPDGRFQFAHLSGESWQRFDMLDGDLLTVPEQDLPPDLVLLAEWQDSQRAVRAVALLYGEAAQLALDLAGGEQ